MKDDEMKDINTEEVDDILEFEFNDDGEEDIKKTLKKLREDLKLARKEKEEYLTGWQKTQADFINLRKRDELERIEKEKFAIVPLIEDILPAIDSYELAKSHKESWEAVSQEWRSGIESIFNQLANALQGHGLISFGAVGDKFDPNKHDAVTMTDSDSEEHDDCLATVFQKGYELHGRVIRPAKVAVWRHSKG